MKAYILLVVVLVLAALLGGMSEGGFLQSMSEGGFGFAQGMSEGGF